MKFWSVLRDGVRMNDLFYSTEMLRFDKEMEYRSVTGGLFSLAIIVAVLVGFASMIIDTLALNTINSVELITKDSEPSASSLTLGGDSRFMMAVELWGVNMTAPVRYFDVLMIQLSTTNGQRQFNYSLIPLSPCTQEHWASFPNIVADFDRLAMENWLCPPIGTTLQLNGDYTSNIYQYVNISVNPCIQYLNPYQPCASAAEVADIFASHNDAIRFKVYYTNPLINSAQKDYKSYYLETSNYLVFGAEIGGEAFMQTCDYQISTDNSIWPYSSILEDNGLLIQDKLQFHPYTTKIGTYAAYYLVKSPTNYVYRRQVQKISTVFSFIGGLVSAISAALFVFKAYNTLAFELTVALSIFKPPDGADIEEDQLSVNFATFFKYYFYQFCEKMGKPRQWPVVKYLVECRREILSQLDVKALIKRVIFLEYCMNHLFEDYQLEGLQLQKPRHPTQIANIRQKMESLDTYEDHLFNSSSSKSLDKSEESYSSESIVKKRDSISNSNGLFTFKANNKNMYQFSKPNDETPSDPNKINCSAAPVNLGRLQILRTNRVHPMGPIAENLDFDRIENIKEGVRPQQLVTKEARLSKAEIRRSINMSFLKKNAEEGNALSKKIWEQLEYYNLPNKQSRQNKFAG